MEHRLLAGFEGRWLLVRLQLAVGRERRSTGRRGRLGTLLGPEGTAGRLLYSGLVPGSGLLRESRCGLGLRAGPGRSYRSTCVG